jgi:hypothetical protein
MPHPGEVDESKVIAVARRRLRADRMAAPPGRRPALPKPSPPFGLLVLRYPDERVLAHEDGRHVSDQVATQMAWARRNGCASTKRSRVAFWLKWGFRSRASRCRGR